MTFRYSEIVTQATQGTLGNLDSDQLRSLHYHLTQECSRLNFFLSPRGLPFQLLLHTLPTKEDQMDCAVARYYLSKILKERYPGLVL